MGCAKAVLAAMVLTLSMTNAFAADGEIDLRQHAYTVAGLDYLGMIARPRLRKSCWAKVGSVISMNLPEEECLAIESGARGPDGKVTRWFDTGEMEISNDFFADQDELDCATKQLAQAEKAISSKKGRAEPLRARGVGAVLGYVLRDFYGQLDSRDRRKISVGRIGDDVFLVVPAFVDQDDECVVLKSREIAAQLEKLLKAESK